MLFIYRFLINLVFIISPIILIIRLFKKKENFKRFKEKFCFFTKDRGKGNLLWFHGASVGELQSIIPLVEKYEKKKDIRKILITSNTLSSSKVIEKLKLKKVVHQFFPIDTNFLTKKFINYWSPSAAFFIDSEIWPNTIINLEQKNIPILILNGRITKKTYERWKKFPNFSKLIFSKINLCFSSNYKSKRFLRKLGVKKIKYLGNLKFSQSEKEKIIKFRNLNTIISTKKIWCASSTHYNEEKFIGIVHKDLKKKIKNLFTIIIPRHVERTGLILEELQKLKLNVHLHDAKKKIQKDTDIYLVNAYGQTKSIYNLCKNVFLGGSLINHGGQNPLEATRYGCNIVYGPNVQNFDEIYEFLDQLKLSSKIRSKSQLLKKLNHLFKKQNNSKNIQYKLKEIGNKILNNTFIEINIFLKNDN